MLKLNSLLASVIAASTVVSSTMSVPLSSTSDEANPINVYGIENAERSVSYWYPDDKEIAKQEICRQFDEEYTSVPDLVERYSSYCKINGSEKAEISQLWLEDNSDSYSQFAYTTASTDSADINLYFDPDKSPDIQELYSIADVRDITEITQEKYEKIEYEKDHGFYIPIPTGEFYVAVSVNFNSVEHEKNVALTMKIQDKLKEDFKISHFYIEFNNGTASYNKRIDWTNLYRLDEYGIETPLSEELTEKQIEALNDEFRESGFDVCLDPETYTLSFNSEMNVYEHFDFAEYLYETYGFYSKTAFPYRHIENSTGTYDEIDYDSPYYPKKNSYVNYADAQYSDIPGDLSGNGDVYKEDLNEMSNWLLGAYPENSAYTKMANPQNADLNNDGVIDVFDMVLLRKMLSKKIIV